jgi:hypothetical protein
MIIDKKWYSIRNLTVVYFAVGFIEVISEYFRCKPFLYVFKPLIPLLLMVLYFLNSNKKYSLYYFVLFFSVLTNILFIPDNKNALFLGIIVFSIHRILILIFIIRLLKIKDYFPLLLATIPTLLMFFYILSISEEMPKIEYYLLIIHNILISFLSGIALSNYIMQESYKTSWLLICVLFFVVLQFIVFIEKFYLNLLIFRPLAMTLNVLAFYSFYKFVIITEKSNND